MNTQTQLLCNSAIKRIAEQTLDLQTKVNNIIEIKTIRLSIHTNRQDGRKSVNADATVSIRLNGYACEKEEI